MFRISNRSNQYSRGYDILNSYPIGIKLYCKETIFKSHNIISIWYDFLVVITHRISIRLFWNLEQLNMVMIPCVAKNIMIMTKTEHFTSKMKFLYTSRYFVHHFQEFAKIDSKIQKKKTFESRYISNFTRFASFYFDMSSQIHIFSSALFIFWSNFDWSALWDCPNIG